MYHITIEIFCGSVNGREIWECVMTSTADSLSAAKCECMECMEICGLYNQGSKFRAIIKETGDILVFRTR